MKYVYSTSFGVALLVVMMIEQWPAQGFEISWFTIDGGGTALSTGGSFQLAGTIGQVDAGPTPAMSGGSFSLLGGFWPGMANCGLPADVNLDGRRDGIDIQGFVGCLTSGSTPGCSCADMNADGAVGNADVPLFVQVLLN